MRMKLYANTETIGAQVPVLACRTLDPHSGRDILLAVVAVQVTGFGPYQEHAIGA